MTYVFLFLFSSTALAAELPCYTKSVHFQSVPHDKESSITLEANRVKSIEYKSNRAYMTYDLGKETITITTDSFAAERFIKDTKNGRCGASQKVNLIPDRRSPHNQKFKTAH